MRLLVVAGSLQTANAQSPPSMTAVNSGALSGVVRDAAGSPIANVGVNLIGESLATATDSAGTFTLRAIPPGNHTALFRRIGYQSVEYRWTVRSGVTLQIAVSMTPVARRLERVVVEAPSDSRRRGTSSIGGTVTDSAGRPVSGADVRLIGSGLSTLTAEDGQFEFRSLASGSYIVRVRREGLRPANAVMQILDDDNRGIGIRMYGLPKNAHDGAAASGFGIADVGFDALDRRLRAVSFTDGIFGPADLIGANRAPLDQLLQRYREHSRQSSLTDADEGDCLLIDGRRPAYQPLHLYTSVDVQLVEAFRPTAFADDFIVSQMDGIEKCRGTKERHPSYFVLWMRSLR
jgi:hypothetical protein